MGGTNGTSNAVAGAAMVLHSKPLPAVLKLAAELRHEALAGEEMCKEVRSALNFAGLKGPGVTVAKSGDVEGDFGALMEFAPMGSAVARVGFLLKQAERTKLEILIEADERDSKASGYITFGRKRIQKFTTSPWQLWHEGGRMGLVNRLVEEADLDAFERTLCSRSRTIPAVLISETDPYERRYNRNYPEYLVDSEALAAAHPERFLIYTITYDLAYALTDRLGRAWSCFNGAVKVYLPGLDLNSDDSLKHPLLMPKKVTAEAILETVGKCGPVRNDFEYSFWMLDFVAEKSGAPEAQDIRPVSPPPAQNLEPEPAISQAEQIEALIHRVGYLEGEVARLRGELRQVQKVPPRQISYPNSLDKIKEWAEEYFPGRLDIMNRAVRAAKKSKYGNPTLVYRCLEYLATTYRDARLSAESSWESLNDSLNQLGVSVRPISDECVSQSDEYYVRWPTSKDKRRLMDSHIVKGNSRDETECLRIYFFWDQNSQQAVVGWLPSHLITKST